MSRDEFTERTKNTLAKRSGYLCSICKSPTIGPHRDPEKSLSIGIAAHICAAEKGGPRYDDIQTSSERKSISNAIWVCHNCSDVIDKDYIDYSKEKLLEIKDVHEKYIKLKLTRDNKTQLQNDSSFDLIDRSFLDTYTNKSFDSSFHKGATPKWSDIVLDLDIKRDITQNIINTLNIWNGNQIIIPIIGDAGQGKSTIIRRIAFTLAMKGEIVLYQRRYNSRLKIQEIKDIALRSKTVYLFFDDASRISDFPDFIETISDIPYKIVIFITLRTYENRFLRSLYTKNIEILTPYNINTISNNEIFTLLKLLSSKGEIRDLSNEEIDVAVEFHSKRSSNSMLVLIMELTNGEKLQEIIRKEVEYIKIIGGNLLKAYRYIAIASSLRSFLTFNIITDLIGDSDIEMDILENLLYVVEIHDQKIYMRHDKIGEISRDILFENMDKQLGEAVIKIIKSAFKNKDIDMVHPMINGICNSMPRPQTLKVSQCVIDESYDIGDFKIISSIIEEMIWYDEDVFIDLVISRIALIIEKIVLPNSLSRSFINWNDISKAYNISLEKYTYINKPGLELDKSNELSHIMKWCGNLSMGLSGGGSKREFLKTIVSLIFIESSLRYHEYSSDIYFKFGEILRYWEDYEDSINMYEKSIANKPDYIEPNAAIVISLYMIGRYKEAYEYYCILKQKDIGAIFRVESWETYRDIIIDFGDLEGIIFYDNNSIEKYVTIQNKLNNNNLVKYINISGARLKNNLGNTNKNRLSTTINDNLRVDEVKAAWDTINKIVKDLPFEKQNQHLKRLFNSWGRLRSVIIDVG